MTKEKFISEIDTLSHLFQIYCEDKHTNLNTSSQEVVFKDSSFTFESTLCEECTKLLHYATQNIKACPHQIKPRCRRCPNPCFEKTKWKQIAKMMRYSGIKLGLTKLKSVKLHFF